MAEAVSRELILPAIRLDVPPRPSKQQVAALAERSAEQWTTGPLEWAVQQVVRLAVARLLTARLEPGPGRAAQHPIPTDPEQATLAQLATLFRPHVGLAAQAFELAVVEAVNSGVPAAVDPLREGLRRVGVTGRDSLRVVALGLDKLPPRARPAFWDGVRTSATVTAVVDGLSAAGRSERPHDLSGLDRSDLARADALVLAGGRITPISLSERAPDAKASWLSVPLALTRRGGQSEPAGRGGSRGGERGSALEVALRGDAWVEVFETALDAVGSAMQQIDLGARPRGRTSPLTDALATRLVAAKDRTVADVCASLRALEPFALELFDEQVTTSAVPVAVPALEDDLFVQLWLPTSALAGPLFTGAPDLFLGGAPDYRAAGARPGTRPDGRAAGRAGRPARSETRPGGRPGGESGREPGEPGAQPGQPGGQSGGRSKRRGRGRRPGTEATEQPAAGSGEPADDRPGVPAGEAPPTGGGAPPAPQEAAPVKAE